MTTYDVDVVVLGLGPGGEYAAQKLAEAGLDVVGIDRDLVGGECPFYGCIPSKMMIRAADALGEARRVDQLAGHADVTPDWGAVATRIDKQATNHWRDESHVERLEEAGVRIVRGQGELVGTGTSTSRPAAWCSTSAPARPGCRSTAWPTRRTSPTARW
jgi:pyruvate/2-oxoglutarate dehydrogenase complex dihydrolipoamide dehydrogenase (E3) component